MLKYVCPASHCNPHVGLVFCQAAELCCCLIEIVEGGYSDVVLVRVVRDFNIVVSV